MYRSTDCPDMTIAVYHRRKATTQQQYECYIFDEPRFSPTHTVSGSARLIV